MLAARARGYRVKFFSHPIGAICACMFVYKIYSLDRPGQDVKQSIETEDAVWQGSLFVFSIVSGFTLDKVWPTSQIKGSGILLHRGDPAQGTASLGLN